MIGSLEKLLNTELCGSALLKTASSDEPVKYKFHWNYIRIEFIKGGAPRREALRYKVEVK